MKTRQKSQINVLYLLVGFLIILFPKTNHVIAQDVRPPAVAGQFYPADAAELRSLIRSYLEKYEKKSFPGDVYAIIVPHAGYPYSGAVAAASYRQLEGNKYDAVVIIAPSHRESFMHVSIYPGKGLQTPLGVVEINRSLAEKIEKSDEIITFSKNGYGQEHSLEVQLPFLQTVLPGTPVVPMIMGYQNFDVCYKVGRALGSALKGEKVLLIASTDLSHFHSYDEAVRLDKMVIEAIENYDPFLLSQNLFSRDWEACGGGPVVAVMAAAQKMGANGVSIMKYANSGDVSGDKSSVVGYVSAVITSEEKAGNVYSTEEREKLLAIAREAVELTVRNKKLQKPESLPAKFTRNSGAFVTLKINGQLRGCIGNIFADKPLADAVQSNAVSAAVKDPRFTPVNEKELALLEYEISVLSPLRLLNDINEIEIGKHGLLMARGRFSGLLLPQVPVEWEWDRIKFLEQTCKKAELPAGAWKDPQTVIFIFSAEVFGEHDK